MNNWDFNELTQQDLFDYKACKHDKTGEIYGIKDSSTCQSGKEIDSETFNKLALKARSGDKKAAAEIEKINKAREKGREENRKEKQAAAEAKKKKEAAEAEKGKKGKGKKGGGKKGGGKKAGGKGKAAGGKGKGGGAAKAPAAKAAPKAPDRKAQQQAKKEAVARARDTVKQLQKMLRESTDPKARKQIEKAIGDLMKSVVDASKADMGQTPDGGTPAAGAGQVAGKVQGEAAKNEKA